MGFDRERLAYLREQAVMTQQELADMAGLTVLSIHKIENGKQEPRPATIRKIARALRVKPSELVGA